MIALVVKPKELQVQKLNHHLWASPYLIFLQQQAIPRRILIGSWYIHYLLVPTLFYIVFLAALFLFSPHLQEIVTVGTYAVFSVMWLCLGMAVNAMFPASDAGDQIPPFKLYFLSFLVTLVILGGLIFLQS